jgi:hypothetical protein
MEGLSMKLSLLSLLLGLLLISVLQSTILAQTAEAPAPPKYCHPCLFYSGDFDGKNGLANEKDIIVSTGAEVLLPLDVPASGQWTVTGLFTNDLSNVTLLDPPKAYWSIRKDVKEGYCGTVVTSGNSAASFKPTGRGGFGDEEYTALTRIKPVVLPPGRYWLTTVPECTNTHDSNCDQARYFISSTSGKHSYGPKEPCDVFFNSEFLGTCQRVSNKQNCGRFSAGALGTK